MRRSIRPDQSSARALSTVLWPGVSLAAALTTAMLLVCLLVVAATAGVAGAVTKPSKPVAKSPKGTITSATPTFTWGKAKGATKYEVRIYQGSKLVVKKLSNVLWILLLFYLKHPNIQIHNH